MFTKRLRLSETPGPDAADVPSDEPGVPTCSNVVITSTLNSKLHLHQLVIDEPQFEYNPSSFALVIGHSCDPSVTFLIAGSTQVVTTGQKNIHGAQYAMRMLLARIKRTRPRAWLSDLRVRNYTCKVYTGFCIDIVKCTEENGDRCVRYQETFPGMHVVTGVGTITHIVFFRGRIVVTGALSNAHADASLRAMSPMYMRYLLPADTPQPESYRRGKAKASAAVELASDVEVDEDDDEVMAVLNDDDVMGVLNNVY